MLETKKLKREITLIGALSTVMGTVIGAGVFFKAAAVVAHTQSAGLALFAWLLAGFLTICGGLTVAELATAIPKTGGAIQYIEVTYGKLPAFLLGWAQSIIYFTAKIAALSPDIYVELEQSTWIKLLERLKSFMIDQNSKIYTTQF